MWMNASKIPNVSKSVWIQKVVSAVNVDQASLWHQINEAVLVSKSENVGGM